ncbi:hypothetical protein DFO50_12811 [Microvirgula sp. AG722]|uniref:hypothetical protein n=1 Tax=Microvirgula sp. AG722 TaxID=2183901 RepID=UPI000DC2B8E4|nr:hypothetical protein [Microvirgula sp. AG722]RAS09958.1 hypothetical protein DFO50_12811 [Microvirgula sp. AG722]
MSDELFPKARSAEILGELSAWTSVADVMAAARILEERTVPGDQPENLLLMPLEHTEPAFEQIFVVLLGYLMDGYVVPSQKVAVCRALDPQITEATETALQALRFRPTVLVGRIHAMHDKRAFFIQDQPAAIELIRAPLNCLMGLYLDKYEYTKSLCDMVAEAEEKTGGRPTIFHRPYADACLPSFIEAACFYSLGLEVGTRFASPGLANIDNAYRAVNVQTLPPVDPAVLGAAIQDGQRMLDALR